LQRQARCWIVTWAERVMARSAWAAAVGSSLGLSTRLPEVRLLCSWVRRDWRPPMLLMAEA
jgi:hypothetical protein